MAHKQATTFSESQPVAVVVSHERSGTHFLMNSLATCYGYVSDPWVDLDYRFFKINYHNSGNLTVILLSLAELSLANVVKSHHQVEFFTDVLSHINKKCIVFYVYREPSAVMQSYWRLIHGLPWSEGPKVADPATFAISQPYGQMMRYQMNQYPTILERWANHVEGWLTAAVEMPSVVIPVRYENLDLRYEETMRGLSGILGREPHNIARPPRDPHMFSAQNSNLVVTDATKEKLRRLCETNVGDTMRRLGYLDAG